jgi:hypothetical protein
MISDHLKKIINIFYFNFGTKFCSEYLKQLKPIRSETFAFFEIFILSGSFIFSKKITNCCDLLE